MHEQEPVDLSALDPLREPDRWREFVDQTMRRVEAVLVPTSTDPLTLIASWSRSLVVTSALVIAVLIPVELMLERREASAEQVRTLVRLSTETVLGTRLPTGAELSRALSQDTLR